MPKDNLESLYTQVAKKVLTETLRVQSGDSVTVEAWDNGLPFARRALAEARAMGCTAILLYEDEWAYVEGVRRAPEEAVGKMGKNEYGLLSGTDAYIFVPGQAIGAYSRTLRPEERERSTRYNSSWYEGAAKAGLRGARLTFGYVGTDLARMLGRPVQDLVRAHLKAALVDFDQISRSAANVSALFTDGAETELGTARSTLKFSLMGELTVDDGIVDQQDKLSGNNMTYVPPGLVSKEVDPESANGSVVLTDTLTAYGVISHAKLGFREGRLAAWESSDRARMKKLVDSLPEKRRFSLLTVGLNPGMRYGLGQDRFVEGSLTLGGFGFRGQVKGGTLKTARSNVVSSGRLQT